MVQQEILTRAPCVSAVLDEAHVGDIRGALGTVRARDHAPRHSWKARLLALAAIMGPGLIVMVGDNDAGGVATYAQAGQNYGTSLLWTLVMLIPVLIVNQEMVVRLGAVTGVGHARLIIERFGRFWGAFSVGDLFVLNFLTIVTEFIGVSLAAQYFGIRPIIAVPLAAAALVAVTVSGSFRRWERAMYVLVLANFLVLGLAAISHGSGGTLTHDALLPHIEGEVNSTAVLLIIAIVGTTVAPWQLFFQQSNVIDKRITPRWINYERADTVIGAVVVVVGAAAIMIATAAAFGGTPLHGRFGDAGTAASGLAQHVGAGAGAIFALILFNAALIGASAVTLSTSYAFGDVFGVKHSLHRSWRDAWAFYASFTALVGLAAVIVLLPNAPLGLITVAVQALAGVLLPSATVFLLLLCNDRAVLGPWTNAPWLNGIASLIVTVLLMLSGILVATTLFPQLDVTLLLVPCALALAFGLTAAAVYAVRGQRRHRVEEAVEWAATTLTLAPVGHVDLRAGMRLSPRARARQTWRMPPLTMLERPAWSRGRRIGMIALRGYLVVAVLLLVVKAVQLVLGH
jgi:Mn2+/Fe2+ NRAMP family transporter